MRIADVHAHVFPDPLADKATRSIGDFYETPLGNRASLENFRVLRREAGIGPALLCNSAVNAHQAPAINTFLAEMCREDPEILALGALYPAMDGWEEELERIVALGLRGIKIHSDFQKMDIDDPRAVPMYRACARLGLPVLFHMGDRRYDYSAPRRLKNLMRQVPELTAIAAHFGGYMAWEESFLCPQPEGVYYDTSSSLMHLSDEMAKRLLDRFGPERFLFGTDFPMRTPKDEVQRFLSAELGLSSDEKQRILSGNFDKLFPMEATR